MVGYEEQAQHYSMEMTICRPDEGELRLTVLSLTLNILPAVCQDPGGNTLRRSPEIFARWRSQVLRLLTRKVSVWRSEMEPWPSISCGTKTQRKTSSQSASISVKFDVIIRMIISRNAENDRICKENYVLQILTNFEMANSEDLEQLMSITGADRNMAENLLEACGGNLEMAVNMHMEDTGGGVSGLDGGSGLAAAAEVPDEEEVRAPIPQKQEVGKSKDM